MDKNLKKLTSIKKSKLDKEMEKLSKQLQQKEIKPMEYAEKFPLKVYRYSQTEVVQAAAEAFKKDFGSKAYKELMNDFDELIKVARGFVIESLSNYLSGLIMLYNNKAGKKATGFLYQRVIDELKRVYPWLDDEYYPS
ncbi:hypothetical protein [Leptospira santarosai]|uniref:hypothetical protein n=1 Tax=Leptospira santarosai TaxID=28183 RepID=UPI0003737A1A|nr:hypothetical protein [Leptospira santarosai]